MDEVMTAETELAALIPEMWSSAFYPTLKEKLAFISCVSQDYSGEISALGDVVNITSFPQFGVAEEIMEAQAVAADSVTAANTQLVINKQVAKDYIVTKKALRQSIDAQNALRDLAMFSIFKKMQQIIIALIVPSASGPDHAIGFTSGTTLDAAKCLEAKELLDTADVEEIGREMILGAAQINDLLAISAFQSRDYIGGGNPLQSGQLSGEVFGFKPKMTTAAGNTSYFLHPLFMQMAVQQVPEVEVASGAAEGKRTMRVNMDVLFGVKQMSNIRVVTVS